MSGDVVKREVEIWVDVEPVTHVMSADNIDLDEGETIDEWISRQQSYGESAYDFAKELDLFENPTIYLSVVEHYADGTTSRTSGEWSDQ